MTSSPRQSVHAASRRRSGSVSPAVSAASAGDLGGDGGARMFPLSDAVALHCMVHASDQEEQWRAMSGWIVPFEPDRAQYQSLTKYPSRPVIAAMDSALWRAMMAQMGVQGALDTCLLLGLVPLASSDDEDINQWIALSQQHRDLSPDGVDSGNASKTEDAADIPPAENASEGTVRFRVLHQDSVPLTSRVVPPAPSALPPNTLSPERVSLLLSGGAAASPLPHPAASGTTKSVTFFDEHHYVTPLSLSSSNVALAPPAAVPIAANVGGGTGLSTGGALNYSSVSSGAEESFVAANASTDQQRIRDLENEVRELTRQLRLMRSREVMSAVSSATSEIRPSSAAAPTQHRPSVWNTTSAAHFDPSCPATGGSPLSASLTAAIPSPDFIASTQTSLAATDVGPPIPQIMVSASKPLVASTTGGSIVCLPVNYLDPDAAPFVVGMHCALPSPPPPTHRLQSSGGAGPPQPSSHGGVLLIPCSVVEHRFILFVAPVSSRGSVAVSVLCTKDGSLRRYTKPAWMEYRCPQDSNTVLSYHAVNQLMQDVPLPSSATLIDPSENATENMEGLDDEDEDDDGGRGSAVAGDEYLDDAGAMSENGSSVATWTTANTNHPRLAIPLLATPQQHAAMAHRMAMAGSGVGRGDDAGGGEPTSQAGGGNGAGHSVDERHPPGGEGGQPMQHLPLTREMLEMFQPYVFSSPHHNHHHQLSQGGSAGVRTSLQPSESSEYDRSSMGGGVMRHGHRPSAPRTPSNQLTAVSAASVGTAAN